MNLHIDPAEFAPLIEQTVDAAVRRLLDERATTKPDKILVDKPGAADFLGLTPRQVLRLANRDELPRVVFPNGETRFDPADLSRFIESLKRPVAEGGTDETPRK